MTAVELKRQGVTEWLYLVQFTCRNSFVGAAFFLPSFAITLLQLFTGAAIYYLMGQTVGSGAEEEISRFGMSYGTYIVTGVMFNLIMTETLVVYHNAWLQGYWMGNFDVYLQHPGGVSAYLTGNVLFNYAWSAVGTVAYAVVGIGLFGVSVDVSSLPAVLAILMLAVFSLTGLGLMGASTFSLLGAKSWGQNPIDWLMGFGVALLSGVYFPASALPGWLAEFADWLPQTHAIEAARLALSGQGLSGLGDDLLYLAIFGVVTLPLGVWAFAAGLRKVQRDGALTRWS